MHRTVIILCGLFLGCTQSDKGSTDTDANLANCDITVDSTWPEQGANDFYFRDSIEFTLSEADPDARVIFSRPGTQTTEEDSHRIVFTPDTPLPPSTEFEVALDYCHGSPTIDFSTSALGEDLDNPLDIEGLTYRVDLTEARYLENASVAEFLMGWLSRDLLFQVTEIENGAINLRMALATDEGEDAQDVCYRTFDVEGMELDSPDLIYSVDDVLFDFYAGSLQVGDFDLVITIAPDLSWIGGGTFSGWINVTDFSSALDLDDDEDMCDIIDNLDSQCEPCPHDDTQSCVSLAGDRITGTWVDLDLEGIEERDSHPDCDRSDKEE